ncbi:MAG: restriction endonuclease [Muribaculaceae bacterium]
MIPAFQKYLYPFLKLMGDGKARKMSEIFDALALVLKLTPEDIDAYYENSGQNIHLGRCSWAKTWFAKAGVVESPKRGVYVITPAGQDLLNSGVTEITQKLLMSKYPSFKEFAGSKKKASKSTAVQAPLIGEPLDPTAQMEEAFNLINSNLVDDILQCIAKQSPKFFEKLVVKLLVAMGYGGDFEDAALVTKFSGDGGIDGIIKEDALGLDKVYIQAKRWGADHKVSAPDIQQFMGALISIGATKGVYITTSCFTNEARKVCTSSPHIKLVLIDGTELANYMIKYNVGVIADHSYVIKRVDSGFFDEE